MDSGNPKIMTPLEKEWAREEEERVKEAADLAAAMALNESDTVEDEIVEETIVESQYTFTSEHRHVTRCLIEAPELDKDILSEEKFLEKKAERCIFSVKWSPDNRCIAAGYGSGRIGIFDTATGNTRYNVNVNQFVIPAPAASRSYRWHAAILSHVLLVCQPCTRRIIM